MSSGMSRRLLTILALFGLVAGSCAAESVTGQGAARGVAVGSEATTTSTTAVVSRSTVTTTTRPPEIAVGLAIVPAGGAALYAAPDGEIEFVAHEGLIFGFDNREGSYLEVLTTCSETMWLRESDADVVRKARRPGLPGQADVSRATVVVDPGHGSRDWGGVGPTGLTEKEVNLDISDRLRKLLTSPHDVDWASGRITPGSSVPAFGNVWLTRDPAGPEAGDYELSLAYRSHIANTAGADVFVSIHNNTVPTADPDGPGSEVFYAFSVDGSDRLASLIHQELLRGFRAFEADWKGGLILGARTRIDPETDTDYYGILRRASMPAVIVEGVYISEPDEEALLRTPEFRQAYAEAVYRGIVRFLTTDEFGEKVNDPELFTSDAGTVNTSACVVPSQP